MKHTEWHWSQISLHHFRLKTCIHVSAVAISMSKIFFFFCWVLKILNRRHCNSSTTHHKCFFPVDLVSHAAIAKKTVVLKKSQGRWRWLCWLLWHGLSLTETCSSTGSGSTDQGETEEFTDDNFCRKFSLSTADELPHPGSATWPGWEGQQVWQSSYIPRHV